jgi:hypothetical protein
MILADTSSSALSLTLGLFFVCIPTLMLILISYAALVLELNCQRVNTNTVNCVTQQFRFWGLVPWAKDKIENIRSAKLESETYTTTDDDGDTVTRTRYWITVATTNQGTTSLTGRTDDLEFNQQNNLVNELNAFIASGRGNNFAFIYDGRSVFLAFIIIVDGVFVFIGMGILITSLTPAKVEQIILDKQRQTLTRFLPESAIPEQYSLDQITAVELHSAKIENRRQVFQVYLLLKSRGLIIIEEAHSNLNNARRQSQQIAEFLGVPLYERSL